MLEKPSMFDKLGIVTNCLAQRLAQKDRFEDLLGPSCKTGSDTSKSVTVIICGIRISERFFGDSKQRQRITVTGNGSVFA